MMAMRATLSSTATNAAASGSRSAVRRSGGRKKGLACPPSKAPIASGMDVKLIKQAAIFSTLEEDEIARVAEICKEQSFKFGQNIFKEGEPGNRLYIVVTGDVRISRVVPGSGEEALTVLKPGACFGEMAVFDRSERSTDAISNGGTKCLTIT